VRAEEYIRESERRRRLLVEPYDPIAGTGSPIDRVEVEIDEGQAVRLPVEMMELEAVRLAVEKRSTIRRVVEDAGARWGPRAKQALLKKRAFYDFEFFCASAVMIDTKAGEIAPLILNRPQRASMAVREEQRLRGEPIRHIELKHRQYGSTTEKNAYVAWLQNVRRMKWNAYIISLQADQARKIVGRYRTMAQHWPAWLGSITMAPYAGATNAKIIVEREAWIAIGTAKNPNAPSGDTAQVVLISEAGKMSDSTVHNASSLVTNIVSLVPILPETAIMVESTAERSGVWFRAEVDRARNFESGFAFSFTSWVSDETRVIPIEDLRQFAESLDQYERDVLWTAGATLEQIAWYRRKKLDYQQTWQMRQEHPTTPEEAFQGGELRVFDPPAVARLLPTCRDPIATGDLRGRSPEGPLSLADVRFERSDTGRIRVWRWPWDDYGGRFDLERYTYGNRFAAAADVGGRWEGADPSECAILDRLPTLYQQPPEIVAEWWGRGDPDLFAWACCQLALFYGRAYLVIESNFYERRRSRPSNAQMPDMTSSVLDVIRDHYDNLYLREPADDIRERTDYKVGFQANRKSKPMIISALNARLRGEVPGYIERSYRAPREMDSYIVHPDGSMGASAGKHDESVITRALLAWIDGSMPAVREIDKRQPIRTVHAGAAQF
jgi:hypothetical protein